MADTNSKGITLYDAERGVYFQGSRILYVEPNDIFGKPNPDGMPLTPDYSDMCISVQLIGETYDRKRGAIPTVVSGVDNTDKPRKFSLSFERNNNDKDFVPSAESIMQGVKYGEKIEGAQQPQYLTVYYTDISYESYGKREIVEGLGVESIDIKFEANYTPTVVIKFVDVRGAGILGHEEANHVDEQLTGETIYSWFTTQPYPKFKLQVKGFFGRPVTFQLACSGAKARFNSQTGNFEWTATFIAYMWSLLTDIPFNYLDAAPFDLYYGKEYWNSHVNTPEWRLSDGSSPITLYDFMQKITGVVEALSSSDEASVSEADRERVNNIERHIADLKTLRDSYNNLVNKIKVFGDKGTHIEVVNADEENDKEKRKQILLIMSKSTNLKTDNVGIEFMDMYNNLVNDLKSHASKYPSDDINESDNIKLPPGYNKIHSYWTATWNDEKKACYLRYERHYKQQEVATRSIYKLQDIKDTNFSSDADQSAYIVKPNDNMAKWMAAQVNKDDKEALIYGLWCIVNLGVLAKKVESKIIDLETEKKGYLISQSEVDNQKVIEILGFKPSIYNVFKIMMCHLETFVHILFKAKERIDSDPDKRTLASLGLTDIEYTDYQDVQGDYQIPAWPAVFNHGEDNDQNQFKDENIKYFAWVGDLSNNFEEQQVVEKFRTGLLLSDKFTDTSLTPQRNNSVYFPITAHDIMLGTSPFDHVRDIASNNQSNQYGLGSLCGYLCLRAAEIFGIYHKPSDTNNGISSNMAELFGRMDAYNYFSSVGKRFVYEITELGATESQIIDAIKKIATSTFNQQTQNYTEKHEDNSEYFTFENFLNIKTPDYSSNSERQPMLLEDNENYKYVHYYDKNSNGLIPSTITPWDKNFISQYFDFSEEGGVTYFKPKNCQVNDRNMVNINNCMYVSNSNTVNTGINKDTDGVYNNDLFKIVTDTTIMQRIRGDYERIKSHNFKVNDKDLSSSLTDNLDTYLDTYWKIEEDDYKDWFEGATHVLSKKIADFSGVKLMDLSGDVKTITDFKANRSWVNLDNNNVSIIDDKTVKVNGEEKGIGDICVQTSKIRFNATTPYASLMGTRFYYSQNKQMTPVRNEDEYDDRYRSLRAKALLQLMTYSYAKKRPVSLDVNNKTHGSVEEVPYALVALIGGLLWRRKFSNKYGIDPINWKGTKIPFKVCEDNQNSTDYMPYVSTSVTKEQHLRVVAETETHVTLPSCFDNLIPKLSNTWLLETNMYKQFLDVFEDYVDNYFTPLKSRCELVFSSISGVDYADGTTVTPAKFQKFVDDFNNHVTDTSFPAGRTGGNPLYYIKPNVRDSYSYIITPSEKNVSGLNSSLLLLYKETDQELQRLLIEPYIKKCMILDNTGKARRQGFVASCSKPDMVNNIYFSKEHFSCYITAFINELNYIISAQETTSEVSDNPRVTENKDECIPIYYCLKNIWDKWIVNVKNEREFDITDFFYNHFVFIDKWYRNIGDELIINCESMLKNYKSHKAGEKNFLSFISGITTNHRCMFIPMSDYVGFSGNNNIKEDKAILADMFRPIPYNNQPPIQEQNIFCVVYIGPASSIVSETTHYRKDSFDIWSHNSSNGEMGFTTDANEYFIDKDKENNTLDLTGRYGYNVPSFGVSYAHQNQHLFKNINVDMSNPVETEQSLRAYNEIMKQGSREEHKVSFIGQDIFNVFTNYSYTCEVEMMGNAQIRPLMFFQLFNVNLFRGTYMIYQMEHHIVAGNMTTRFKGMKMSKYSLPFNTQIITRLPLVGSKEGVGPSDYFDVTEYNDLGGVEVNLVNHPKDHWNDAFNHSDTAYKNSEVKEGLKHLFNQLYEEIQELPENKGKETQWNIYCTSSYRSPSTNSGSKTSDHLVGAAMDLQIAQYKNGKMVSCSYSNAAHEDKVKFYTVASIIFKLHFTQIRQVLFEFYGLTAFQTQGANNMAMLHVSVNSSGKTQKHEFMVLDNDGGYRSMTNVHAEYSGDQGVRKFHNAAHPNFQQLAAQAYYANQSTFKTYFPNYAGANASTLASLFGSFAIANVNDNNLFGYTTAKGIMGDKFDKFKSLLSQLTKDTGIDPNVFMMIAWEETGFDMCRVSETHMGLGFMQSRPIVIQEVLNKRAEYREYINNKGNLLVNGNVAAKNSNTGWTDAWYSESICQAWRDLFGCTKKQEERGMRAKSLTYIPITDATLTEQFKYLTSYFLLWKGIAKKDHYNNPFWFFSANWRGMYSYNRDYDTAKRTLIQKLNSKQLTENDKAILAQYESKY